MIGWAILAVWALVAVIVWRRFVWIMTKDMALGGDPEGEDWLFGLLVGTLLAWIWPISIPIYIMVSSHGDRGPLAQRWLIPRDVRRELELDEREARIRRLERETGIR